MGRQYSAKTFLRNTPNELLQQYFRWRNLDLGFDWSYLHETDVDPLFVAMEDLPEATRTAIDSDFTAINDVACQGGVLAILEKAGGTDRGLGKLFAGMRNAYERAFWTFLHEPDVFRLAGCFHEMDRRVGWRRRFVGVRLDVPQPGRHDGVRLADRGHGHRRFPCFNDDRWPTRHKPVHR